MAKPLTNLSIRVNIPEEKEYQVKEEVVILWERIWGVGIAVLVAIGVIVVLWSTFSGGEEVVQSVKPPELLVADQLIVAADAQVTPVKPVPIVAALKPSPAIAVAATAPAITGNAVKNALAIAPEVAPLDIVEPEVAVAEPLAASDLVPAVVTTSSKHLSRAILTTEMQGRQPVGEAPAVLQVPQGELLTVYFFTELKGLRKQTVHYDWFRNEKRVARVKIRPRFDTTGNFSSKYIDRNMRGQWRVLAKTASGELLATAHFEVR